MKYLLGIDFGGGSAKATLLSTEGKIVATADAEYETYHVQSGFCEQKPQDWLRALSETTEALFAKSGIDVADILCVALDSATHTAVLCDEDYRPVHDAIHWTDARAKAESRELLAKYGERIFALTYHKPDTIWTMPQILWIKNHEPEVFARIKHIFFEKDYIRYALTGTYQTDGIEAVGSMLYDCVKGEFSKELCSMIGITPDMLPPLCKPTDIIGAVTREGALLSHLREGTPVICGTTDTVMEVFASGAVHEGDMTVKLATAGRICVITDRPYPDRDLVTYPHVVDGLWYPGSATKAAASSLRWYRDTFGGKYNELDAAAAEVPIGADGLIFHPYLNGELTPYADPTLCADFIGVRSGHTKAHFTRSVLEGVALSLLHCKEKLISLGIKVGDHATLIGGGAQSPLWASIVSDCLGISLSVMECSDSSFGSAMLAGVAIGIFDDFADAASKCVHKKSEIHPNMDNHKKYAELFCDYVALHDALAPFYHAREARKTEK